MRAALTLLIVAAIAACSRPESPASVDTSPSTKIPDQSPTTGANATVSFMNLEGGCWTLVTTSSTQRYLPDNLPAEYKVDGKKVNVTFHELENAASTCMVGPVVHIDKISAP